MDAVDSVGMLDWVHSEPRLPESINPLEGLKNASDAGFCLRITSISLNRSLQAFGRTHNMKENGSDIANTFSFLLLLLLHASIPT